MHPETTHFAASILRIEQGIDALLLILAILAGVVLLRREVESGRLRPHRRVIEATLALALLALALRLALFPPAFVHANFRGPRLVDDILGMPRPATSLGSYGQVTFLVLGGLARVFGRSFETIARANAVFGVATLVLAGALAARWTGRPACAPLGVAVGALMPALARVACSEDAHVLGGLLGLVALLSIDVYAERDDGWALALAVASGALMVGSRQTYYPWAPAIVAMGVARGGWGILRRRAMQGGAAAILLALALRLVATALNEPAQVGMLPAAFASPRLAFALLAQHPLLDVRRFALGALPLEALGIVAMRGAPMRRAVLLLLAVTFVVTLPLGFPLPGVECSFRTPVLLLALTLAAGGAERLFCARPVGLVPLLAAMAAPILLPTWALLRAVTPVTREYVFVRDVAARALPQGFVLAELRAVDPMPSYRLAESAFSSVQGEPVRRIDARSPRSPGRTPGPVYFLAGLQCRGRSLLELSGYTRKVETLPLSDLVSIALMGVEGRVPRGGVPSELRDACVRLLEGAEPVGPSLTLEHAPPEDPFVLYGDAPVSIQFWKLPARGGS